MNRVRGIRTWGWMALTALGLVLSGSSALVLRGQEAVRDDSLVVQLERQANSFFDGLLADDSAAAFDRLLTGSPIAARGESVRDLKQKTTELETRYGRYRGFERLETRRLGQDVVLLRYFLKCENYPVLWQFTFYRVAASGDVATSRENWKLITLKFDTQFEQLGK